ncbi:MULTISPECIES: pseudouridine synthase [Salimicrobium]|uniref:Pseudouridine synthase n=1 Tax=Salimicrobium humidisoli TaxID=2029857 RepID=A0ABX4HQX9_9BACI|nr:MULTISPECIES: pseudouridine synthase [Salimicrobium]PBB05495.1 pseudouridine synthase [Salimicrobium humidisoli]
MERLQKVMAQAGVASRRKSEELIKAGRVKVNNETIKELGTKVSSQDEVEVDGVPLQREAPVYFLLYKPRGVISSSKDDRGRQVVTDYIPEIDQRLFPVGRLDYDTSGLILLTNDGEFANKLMHPKHKIDKVYIIKSRGIPTREQMKQLKQGMEIEGEFFKAEDVRITSTDGKKNTAIIQMTLHQGKNRQVRKMFDALGVPVDKLKREQYGFLNLHGLNAGDFRPLKPHEVKQLRQLADENVK